MNKLWLNIDRVTASLKILSLTGLSLWPVIVHAAESSSRSSNPAIGGGLVIAIAVAHFSRRRPIGGWLLVFYIQLYINLFITLFSLPSGISNFSTSVWGSTQRYVFFVATTGSLLLIKLAEVLLATWLLRNRNERTLQLLRQVLVFSVIACTATLIYDAGFGEPVSVVWDVLGLFFAIVWFTYFWKSRRVRMVFVDRNWDYEAESARKALTSVEKQYRWKRVGIWSAVTYVAAFLIIGAAQGDKAPDAVLIFAAPLVYTFWAAIFAWYGPIRKRRREEMQKNGQKSLAA